MKRETVGAMAILEVVGGDRGYRISFTCPKNRDEEGVQETNRKVAVFLGPLYGMTNIVYLSLAPRIGRRRRGGPRKQKSGLPFGTSFWDIQYCISLACPKNRDKDSRNTQQGAKGNFDH